MLYGIDLFFALFQNLAIFIALVALYSYLLVRFSRSHWCMRQIVLGLSFGIFAIGCMYARIPVFEGVIVDQRNAVVALSGLFGGPLSAITSAALAGAFRIYLGGDGVIGGLVGLTLAALAGIAMNIFSGRFSSIRTAAISALLATIVILPGFIFIKGHDIRTGLELLKNMTVPYGMAIFLGIFLVGLLIRREEKRYRIELLFRDSEKKYRRLFDNMSEHVVIDELVQDDHGNAVDWRILDVNPAYLRKMGRSREEVIGRRATELYGVRTARSCIEHFAAVVRDGNPVQFEEYFDTLEVHSHVSAFHLCGNRFATVSMDVSERKRMEAELRRSHEELELRVRERTAELKESHDRFRMLVDLLPEMVFETDARGYCTYANRQVLETFHISPDEFRRGFHMQELMAEKDFDRMMENMRRILDGEPLQGSEYSVRRSDGSEFVAFIRANRVEREGNVIGTRGIVIDLTDARKAEAEKKRLEEQLRHSQKMEAIGTLAGGIAHDFNNMLAIILGNAELALDDLQAGDAPSNLKQIVEASKRARDLTRQILTFSRKTERGRNPMRLGPLLEETCRLLRGTLPTTVRIKLNIETESDTVLADPTQVQQVLVNLATNGAYAMRKSGGTLEISLSNVEVVREGQIPAAGLSPGRYARLCVRDTGTGMNEKVRSRVFEPFFTTKGPGRGTGMGLAVVYGIVKNHQGDITVESMPGQGSTFSMYLPLVNVEAAVERDEARKVGGGTEHILLIDDEPGILQTTSQILKGLGYRVTTAPGGLEGWSMFRGHPESYDLVITDHVMPDLPGMALAKKILTIRPDIPVILFTGYSEAVSSEQAKAAGVREFVMKPVTTREVAEAVRRALDDPAGGPASARPTRDMHRARRAAGGR